MCVSVCACLKLCESCGQFSLLRARSKRPYLLWGQVRVGVGNGEVHEVSFDDVLYTVVDVQPHFPS